jgi:hypothetical protein
MATPAGALPPTALQLVALAPQIEYAQYYEVSIFRGQSIEMTQQAFEKLLSRPDSNINVKNKYGKTILDFLKMLIGLDYDGTSSEKLHKQEVLFYKKLIVYLQSKGAQSDSELAKKVEAAAKVAKK